MLQSRTAALLGLASVLAVTTADATNGYMPSAFSPSSKGMAGSGQVAMPQDALTVICNPAGLHRVGERLDFGLALFSPRREYQGITPNGATGAYAPIGGGPTGTGTVESGNDYFVLPTFGFIHLLNPQSAIGVAMFGNGGMNTDYRSVDTLQNLGTYGGNNAMANPPHYSNPRDPRFGQQVPGTSLLGGGDTGTNLTQIGIVFAFSHQVLDSLTLGASFLLARQSIEVQGIGAFQGFTQTFTQSMVASGAASGTSPSNLTDRGPDSSWGYGVQLGALWDLSPEWTLGLSLRSRVYVNRFRKYSDLFAEGGDLDVPPVACVGLAWKPTKRLGLALDVQQVWYSDVAAMGNTNQLEQKCDLNAAFGPGQGSSYDPSYCLGGANGAGFGWKDMTIWKLGVQYALTDNLTLRAGYSRGNQIISAQEIAFNALAPAVIREHWALGGTYRFQKQYELIFWGIYAPQETVTGSGAFTGTQAASLSMSQYELGLSVGWLIN